MAAPSVKCQHAVEKDRGKAMPSPRALSPVGGHRSQVFVVNTEGAISSLMVTDQQASHTLTF